MGGRITGDTIEIIRDFDDDRQIITPFKNSEGDEWVMEVKDGSGNKIRLNSMFYGTNAGIVVGIKGHRRKS
jgi:hypothetical protein